MQSRPYVVVQFEQNEFVSREPTDETEKEVKGIAIALSRNGSSNALTALGVIAAKRAVGNTDTSTSSSSSSNKATLAVNTPVPLFGRMSAHNPVWKHEVSL
jgi:hypothetical protein